jgi:ABC-2 type transport system ATP-binding protein
MPVAPTATDSASRLSARGLCRRFGERVALRPLDLELRAGERVAVIGPNGAGKTTLLSILAGVLEPSAGELRRGSGGLPGWVPQQPALYGKLSVAENLRLFARLERLGDPDAATERMLRQSGLAERAGEQVARLSGGAQQRVNIAIGLLSEPAVLLLDEPSSSLDPRQRERLWEFIAALARGGTTVVFSTHNVAEAERYGDRVLVLSDGELVFTGTPAALRGAAAVPPGGDFEAAFVSFLRARGH